MSKNLPDQSQIVWRYMTFSRFIWLLHKRALWFSRVDRLDDAWEMALAGAQLDHTLTHHPVRTIGSDEVFEPAIDYIRRTLTAWRSTSFVNCWSGFGPESHALWRVFCSPNEGVAIRTTLMSLKKGVPRVEAKKVEYREPGIFRVTPTRDELITVKRKSFEYEQEIRLVATDEISDPSFIRWEMGLQVPFDFENIIDGIIVHPGADESFFDTVVGAVDQWAPKLTQRVAWSHMRQKPPLSMMHPWEAVAR